MKDLSTPNVLDVEALLAPIPGEQPSGVDLTYEPEYDQIREARRNEEELAQGDWKRDRKVADWDLVVAISTRCLAEQTKDLQIAAWLTEALMHLHGFAGLRDGLRLMLGIQSTFWDSYYPQVDEGDLESRHGPFLFLNDPKLLPRLLHGIPLTDGDECYSYHRYQESRDVENALRKAPGDEKTLLASGKIRAEQFDKAVATTPRRFYERLLADLQEARDAFKALDQDTDEHFGHDAPSLLNIGKALDDCFRLLKPILAEKRSSQPDPELDAPEPELEPELEPESVPTVIEETAKAESPAATAAVPATSQDFGRLLIEFQNRAQELAEAGEQLRENREKHAALQAQMHALDREYEEISRRVCPDQESHQLLARLLNRPRGSATGPVGS